MGSQLIKLEDGTLVEVEVRGGEMDEISSDNARAVKASFEKVQDVLKNVCRPIISMWQELNQEVQVEQAEVEIGFSFESEGNVYITKAKAGSNIKVKLVLKPKTAP